MVACVLFGVVVVSQTSIKTIFPNSFSAFGRATVTPEVRRPLKTAGTTTKKWRREWSEGALARSDFRVYVFLLVAFSRRVSPFRRNPTQAPLWIAERRC